MSSTPTQASSAVSTSDHSDTNRIRIQALNVTLEATSNYPTVIQLQVDDKVLFKGQRIAQERSLRWEVDIPFDATPRSKVRVRVLEKHALRSSKLVSFSFPGQDVLLRCSSMPNERSELKLSKKGFDMTIEFASADSKVNMVASQVAVGKAVDVSKVSHSFLSKHGEVWTAVKTIRDMVAQLAEIHPVAKAAFMVVNGALQLVEQQETYDSNIHDLTLGMADMLSFVNRVRERAKVDQLKQTVEKTMKLIEDASIFIIQYLSQSRTKRYLEVAISSKVRGSIDEFTKQFKELKERFDRSISVQVLETVDTAEEKLILAGLRSVVEACGPSYDDQHVCMDGTRQKVLQDIENWAVDITASPPFLWIHGLAGVGKSSIACSIAQRLHNLAGGSRLGATFFCKRDNSYLSDPKLVIPRIASRLASAHKPFGKAVAAALQAEPDLATEAVSLQFKGLIKNPLGKFLGPSSPLVIIVDALDECRASRGQLLSVLHEMSGLVPWLRVIVTSRPDPDIKNFFDTLGTRSRPLDLDQEDPYEDMLIFVTRCMAEIAQNNPPLPPTWPGAEIIRMFAKRAGRLFIWARVASDFISNGPNVQRNLDVVLAERVVDSGPYKHLDTLYKTTLEHNITNDEYAAQTFRDVVGTIVAVATRDPLPTEALQTLLEGEDVPPHALRRIIQSLRSVLYEDKQHNNAIRLCHPSFMDFLTNSSRCPSRFYIDLKQQNISVARMCLRTMISGLKFNICGLESSHRFNADIVDLKERINCTIYKALGYSCIRWHSHLGDSSKEERTLQLLEYFFSGPLPLYWVEALSLLGALQSAISGLLQVVKWFENGKDECSRFAAEMYRFVTAFYEPMSLSTPHIYISALPLAPRYSIIYERLHPLFSNSLEVLTGQEKHWSACLHISDMHTEWVESVAFSSDGKRIVSGSRDYTVRIWDAETGAAVFNPLEGHTDAVMSVVFSPDSKRIASGSLDSTVRIWDTETGLAVSSPFAGHTGSVISVAFSPDGRRIVSGSADKTVQIWDAEKGKATSSPLEGHTGPVNSVAFSPDGRHIVSGSDDSRVRIWDADTGAAVSSPLGGHTEAVMSVAFSPDGRRIVSGSRDYTVRIWDTETGLAAFSALVGHTAAVSSVTFTPDGRRIASGSWDKTIRIWDAETGREVCSRLEGHTEYVSSVAFSSDGQRIVSGSDDETIRIWDAEMFGISSGPIKGHTNVVSSVALPPDGRRIVSGSWDDTIRIWDANTGETVAGPLKGHTSAINSVAFSPDGRRVASGSWDKTVQVWNAETGEVVFGPLKGHFSVVSSVAFSPDGRRIVSGSWDNTIQIWDAETGVVVCRPLEGHTDSVSSVTFSQDGRRIASGSWDKTGRIWDAEIGTAVLSPLVGHTEAVNCVAFSPDDQWIVSGSDDKTVRLWDAETCTLIFSLLEGHTNSVQSVVFSPDGRWIASGSYDKTIRIWDGKTGAVVSGPLEGHAAAIISVTFSPDGRQIVSGSWDKTVRIWDAETGPADHPGQVDESVSVLDGEPVMLGLHNYTIRTRNIRTTPSNIVRKLAEPVDSDGWIRLPTNDLLLWIPVQYRNGLVDQCVMSIPIDASVAIDCRGLCHGTSWTSVQS